VIAELRLNDLKGGFRVKPGMTRCVTPDYVMPDYVTPGYVMPDYVTPGLIRYPFASCRT